MYQVFGSFPSALFLYQGSEIPRPGSGIRYYTYWYYIRYYISIYFSEIRCSRYTALLGTIVRDIRIYIPVAYVYRALMSYAYDLRGPALCGLCQPHKWRFRS